MQITSAELNGLIGTWLYPMFRIGAMVMAAPVLGTKSVPARTRLITVIALTLVIVPVLPASTAVVVDLFSPMTFLLIIQQILIGVMLGFSVQLVFSAVITGGQIIAMQMGLGFSVMVDPQNGAQAPVLSQFYVMMIILVYLALNGHLVLVEVTVESFRTMPIGDASLLPDSFHKVAMWGSQLFAGGLAIALPAIASLLVVNIAFGIMTRAAPQLNIFAIGFPITIILGFAVILITLPSTLPQSMGLFNGVFDLLRSILIGGR